MKAITQIIKRQPPPRPIPIPRPNLTDRFSVFYSSGITYTHFCPTEMVPMAVILTVVYSNPQKASNGSSALNKKVYEVVPVLAMPLLRVVPLFVTTTTYTTL